MPIANANGITIYYEDVGRGRPLVLSHGFACGAAMWAPQVACLADRYRVITYDVRGHGASTAPEAAKAYSQAISVEDLYQLMLRLGLRDVCLGGLSMGGGIALEFALAHPDLLSGLIVADAYGAHMHCEAPEHRLPAPTRKSMTIRFALAAAQRINRLIDPQGHGEF